MLNLWLQKILFIRNWVTKSWKTEIVNITCGWHWLKDFYGLSNLESSKLLSHGSIRLNEALKAKICRVCVPFLLHLLTFHVVNGFWPCKFLKPGNSSKFKKVLFVSAEFSWPNTPNVESRNKKTSEWSGKSSDYFPLSVEYLSTYTPIVFLKWCWKASTFSAVENNFGAEIELASPLKTACSHRISLLSVERVF